VPEPLLESVVAEVVGAGATLVVGSAVVVGASVVVGAGGAWVVDGASVVVGATKTEVLVVGAT